MKKFIKNLAKSHSNDIFLLLNSMNHFSTLTPQYKLMMSKHFKINSFNALEQIHSQNSPIKEIYIVKKGSFSLTYLRKTDTPVEFTLDHFHYYQSISNERFTSSRKYELDGKLSYEEQEKIVIYGEGEIIGDIEWYMGRNTYFFNIVANEQGSELISCNFEKFNQLIEKIRVLFQKIVKLKIQSLNNRICSIFQRKKYNFINHRKLYENSIVKQFDITKEFEKRERMSHTPSLKKRRKDKTQNSNESLFYLSQNYLSPIKKYNEVQLKSIIKNDTREQKTSKLLSYLRESNKNKFHRSQTVRNMMVSVGKTRNKIKSFLTNVKPRKTDFKVKKKVLNSSAPVIPQLSSGSEEPERLFYQTNGELRLNYHSEFFKEINNSNKLTLKNSVPLNKKIFLDEHKVKVLLNAKYKFLRHNSQEKLI